MMNIQFVISSHEPLIQFTNVISSQNLKRRKDSEGTKDSKILS